MSQMSCAIIKQEFVRHAGVVLLLVFAGVLPLPYVVSL